MSRNNVVCRQPHGNSITRTHIAFGEVWPPINFLWTLLDTKTKTIIGAKLYLRLRHDRLLSLIHVLGWKSLISNSRSNHNNLTVYHSDYHNIHCKNWHTLGMSHWWGEVLFIQLTDWSQTFCRYHTFHRHTHSTYQKLNQSVVIVIKSLLTSTTSIHSNASDALFNAFRSLPYGLHHVQLSGSLWLVLVPLQLDIVAIASTGRETVGEDIFLSHCYGNAWSQSKKHTYPFPCHHLLFPPQIPSHASECLPRDGFDQSLLTLSP